jgi:TolA-binding protein
MIGAAHREQPPDGSLSRSLAKVGVTAGLMSGVAPTSAPSSATGVAGLTLRNLTQWLSIGLLAGTGASWLAVRANAPVSEPARSVRANAPQLSPAPELPVPPTPAPTPTPTPSTAGRPAPDAPSPVVMAPSRLKPKPALGAEPPGDRERLAEEVALVERARTEFDAGRAGQALVVLDDYAHRFPIQHFAPESLYLRMEALLAAGQRSAALDTARRLSTRHPKSPQAPRARQLLSETIP